MIDALHIKGFKALRDTSIRFNREGLTVLIGPNGAGKSTILEAVQLVNDLANVSIDRTRLSGDAFRHLSFQGRTDIPFWFTAYLPSSGDSADSIEWRLELVSHDDSSRRVSQEALMWGTETVSRRMNEKTRELSPPMVEASEQRLGLSPNDMESILSKVRANWRAGNDETAIWYERALKLKDELGPVRTVRLNPERVAESPPARSTVSTDGFGLPAALLDLQNTRRKSFNALEERFQELFPWVDEVLLPIAGSGKNVEVDLQFLEHGADNPYPATQVSSGMLIALTVLWMLHRPEPDRILLIEEPENSLHPYLLAEVYSLLRRAARGEIADRSVQVVVSTHSVDFVNLCRPDEIRICERDDDGAVRVNAIEDRKELGQAMQTYRGALGELWYSGAMGGFPTKVADRGGS